MFLSLALAAKNIVLDVEKNDFFAISSDFSTLLADEFQVAVMLHNKPELIVYIDSPGGDLLALARMLDVMAGSKIKFTCIAKYAASAAFMFFEHCDNRYMLSDGILMSHNASGFVGGELPRIKRQLDAVQALIDSIDKTIAKRLGMSLKDYQNEIANEMWLSYSQAYKRNAIDKVKVNVTCTKKTILTAIKKTIRICSLFGCERKTFYFSACPLISTPVAEGGK